MLRSSPDQSCHCTQLVSFLSEKEKKNSPKTNPLTMQSMLTWQTNSWALILFLIPRSWTNLDQFFFFFFYRCQQIQKSLDTATETSYCEQFLKPSDKRVHAHESAWAVEHILCLWMVNSVSSFRSLDFTGCSRHFGIHLKWRWKSLSALLT